MTTWIAFFRGINVGGNHLLPMKSLVALLQKLNCTDVRTYIQSGNAVFSSAETSAATLASNISSGIAKAHGFQPRVLLLTLRQLEKAMAANPFSHAEANHKSLHLYFLAETAKRADIAALNAIKAADESFKLTDAVLYLHTPDGIGKSKLAERAEKLLGVAATARNWRTVSKVRELCAKS